VRTALLLVLVGKMYKVKEMFNGELISGFLRVYRFYGIKVHWPI